MAHDPQLTILYSFIGRAIESETSVIVFDATADRLRVAFDACDLELPASIPAGLFGGLRYWIRQLAELPDSEETQHATFVIEDTSSDLVGGPFGCEHNVNVTATLEAKRIELRVREIESE